ncbi:hypothetical protein FOMPIDRAFT_110028 [Fomitopsis schrenkii]|uniref:C2H2-type domain-containing protein n=1 Tax=Fomitopsis schrenkii TaxID=2126942 RepID=S8EMT4_FOMSC|nr:hypothetical protein FOMPIDRAFT_110028 [Fomitopsis schrenkii]
MHPYYPPTQQGQQGQYRHSLSSTTDVSAHYPPTPSYPATAAPSSIPYTHATAQYAAYPQVASGQAVVAHTADPRSAYGGQPLHSLPFTNAQATGAQQPAYPGMHTPPRDPYAQQFNAQAAYNQGPSHHAVHHETRYIPTPAQAMQSYHTLPSGSRATPPQSSPSPGVERYACDRCDRTFSRPHDRKRHYESQHLQTSHACQFCRKEFSRADSLKRHLDNGCDKAPVS